MNGGLPRRQSDGFTIVEIMIVLAVTGALFLSAVFLISGKQNITAYNQSIRNVQTELQQIVNDVGSGFYPNDGNISCTKGGPGGGTLLTSAATEQGANKNCIFLGKVMQFAVHDTNPQTYNIYTLVGLRGDSASPSLDLASAKARVIAKGTGSIDAAVPDAFATKNLLYGLTVSKMYYDGNPAKKIGAVGFASSLSSLGNPDGSQQVNTVAITGTNLDTTKAIGTDQINANLDSGIVNPDGGVQICFNSGGTDQSGLITLGGAGRQGTVDLKIFAKQDCT